MGKRTSFPADGRTAGARAGGSGILRWFGPIGTFTDFSLRCVTIAGIYQKAQELMAKKEWRDWDVAMLARICDQKEEQLFYIDAHQRYFAFAVLCQYFYRTGTDLPAWMKDMAASVSARFLGFLTLPEAKARHLATSSNIKNVRSQ